MARYTRVLRPLPYASLEPKATIGSFAVTLCTDRELWTHAQFMFGGLSPYVRGRCGILSNSDYTLQAWVGKVSSSLTFAAR